MSFKQNYQPGELHSTHPGWSFLAPKGGTPGGVGSLPVCSGPEIRHRTLVHKPHSPELPTPLNFLTAKQLLLSGGELPLLAWRPAKSSPSQLPRKVMLPFLKILPPLLIIRARAQHSLQGNFLSRVPALARNSFVLKDFQVSLFCTDGMENVWVRRG